MRNALKKIISLFLATVIVFSAVPLSGLVEFDFNKLFSIEAQAMAMKTVGYYTFTFDENYNATIIMVDASIGGDVKIPETLYGCQVISIRDGSFAYCENLTSITIPDSVTSIGDYAFAHCTSLTSITIPDSVTSIGGEAFYGCDSLTSITIPDSVTSIGGGAFHDCSSLTSVTIPDSVTSIGDDAFAFCDSLTTITIPNSVTSIGASAFFQCDRLTNVIIPDSVTSIGDSAFSQCDRLTNVIIPDSVTSIGDSAFCYCTSLTTITIPNSVTSIGASAFSSCHSLTSVSVPSSVISIGTGAFSGCSRLTSINVEKDNQNYSSDLHGTLFDKLKRKLIQHPAGNTNVTIPDSVTTIGNSAFSNCYNLASVTIPESVTTIGNSAFSNCYNLASVTIPDSVTTIGNYAFSDCYNLIGVTIPDGVTSIGDSAFRLCKSLTNITIGNNVKSIGNTVFYGCDSLSSITVDFANEIYSSDEYGVLFNKYKTVLICYPMGNPRTSYRIPDSVITIDDEAFYYCGHLLSIIFGNGIINIGRLAFCNCDNLTSVIVPDSVTSIGDRAFYDCDSLISATIPYGVTSLGESLFYRCESLTSVTIPNSVTNIDYRAFYSCLGLTDIYYIGAEENWHSTLIGNGNECLTNATIHFNSTGNSSEVPDDTEKYKNATITLDKNSYTVKEPNLLTIEGTITCPDGVEGLRMSWSFDEIDIFYTPSQTTYETISETEMRFSQTFTPKEAGQFKVYARLPNGVKAECTVESYKPCAPAYITEHQQFIDSNEYNNFLIYKSAENLADSMRGNPSYHWNNLMSMNFFENYYDIVLSELITGETMKKTTLEIFYGAWSKEFTGLLKEVFDFLDLADSGITFEEFLDVFNTNNPDYYKDTTVYKMVVSAIGNNHSNLIDAVFKTSDVIGVAGDIFGASVDVFEGVRECVYYFSAINAYRYTSEYFKDVIQRATELTDNSDLKKSLETYSSIDSESDYIDFAKSLYERAGNSTIQTAVKVFFDMFGIGRTAKFVTNIVVKGGAKLASKVVTVSTKAGTVTATVAQIASGAISGVTLGMAVSEIITSADDYSQYASKCTHAGDFAEVFAKVLKEFENNFNDSKTIEDALRFDAAFNLYKDTQIYALTSIVQSVNAQENSLVAKLLNLKGNITPYISKINCYRNLHCHEHELDELVTGEYYFIDEKYSGNKLIRVACPVNVYVYDSDGNLALSIENDFIEIFDDRLDAFVLNSEKYICVPLDEEFEIKIVSTDDGEMDYFVFEFNENSEMIREISKENVTLVKGKTFEGKVDNILNTVSDNYNLTILGDQEVILMENDIACIPATNISISQSSVELKVGQSQGLVASILPINTTDKYVWISSDESVATVSENGKVNAIGEGNAFIVAMVNDLIYAKCEVNVVILKDYTVTWNIDGATIQQTITEGNTITKPSNPTKSGYTFVGWTPAVPNTMPAHDLTFTAVFEKNAAPAVPSEPLKEDVINQPTETTISYGDAIILHVDASKIPEGGRVEWSADNGNFNYSANGETCRIDPHKSGSTTFTATIYDAQGNAVSKDEQTMISKAGFFQKLIAFFKKIFGLTKVIPQAFKGAF